MSQQLFHAYCTQTDATLEVNQQVFRSCGTHKLRAWQKQQTCLRNTPQKMTILVPLSFKSSACHPLQSLRAQAGWCVSVSGFKRTCGSFCGTSGCGVTRKLTARRAPDLASCSALSKAAGSCSNQESHPALDKGHDVTLPNIICCSQARRRALSSSNSSLCSSTYSWTSRWSGRREQRIFLRS